MEKEKEIFRLSDGDIFTVRRWFRCADRKVYLGTSIASRYMVVLEVKKHGRFLYREFPCTTASYAEFLYDSFCLAIG